jgi:hypothetical protein
MQATLSGITTIHLFIGGEYLGQFPAAEESYCHQLCRGRRYTWHDNGTLRIIIANCL